jgi:hypothetical protein
MVLNTETQSTTQLPYRAVAVLAVGSVLATLWLPPVGAVCSLATAVYAWRQLRSPLVIAALGALTLVGLLASPGIFIIGSGHSATGHHGEAPAPARPVGP